MSSSILDLLLPREQRDVWGRLTEALVLSFVIYAITVGLLGQPVLPPQLPEDVSTASQTVLIARPFVLTALALSILVPIVFGIFYKHDLHMRFLRKIRATEKTGRRNTWLDVFSEKEAYVVVNLQDGRRVFGWPMYFSNSPEEGLLYLYDAAYIVEEEYFDINADGILLIAPGAIDSIEFTDITRQTAKEDTETEEHAP